MEPGVKSAGLIRDLRMSDTQIADWDDAYLNGVYIADADAYPPRWSDEAQSFRNAWMKKDLDIVYGESARQRLDVFHPEGRPKGLVMFVHGGYWMKFDKSYWSQLATGSLANGWTVCMPSYDLTPDVSISEVTRQISQALSKAAQRVDGPIRLTGHSAGGHLVSRLICEDTDLSSDILDRIEKVVSISGLHDLRALRNTQLNQTLQLSEDESIAESPALAKLARVVPVTAWVGGDERPEFIRQSRLLAENWPNADFVEDPGKHHFDVIDALKDAESSLTQALLQN